MFNGITADTVLLFILLISFTAVFSALIISIIKRAFGSKLSPSFHYYIWFVFVLRLLFPIMPESNISIYNLATGIYQSITNPSAANAESDEPSETALNVSARESSTEPATEYEPSEHTQPEENPTVPTINTGGAADDKAETSILYAILIAYLAVTSGSLSVYIIRHQLYKRMIVKSFAGASDEEKQLLEQVKAKLNIRGKILLYKGDESILIGVFSPVMVISEGCADSDKAAVMTHELLHYKGKDNFVNSLLILIKCTYWFNPFIHYFIRKMKDDMELLCDIKSIQTLNYRKDEYAMMLFNASNNKNKKRAQNIPAQATSMSASGKQLIYRLKFISAFRKPSRLMSAIAVALVTVLIATTLTNPIMALGNDWAESYAQFLTDEGVYDYTGVALSDGITAFDYAALVLKALKALNLPYETKSEILKTQDSELMEIVNWMLVGANKISPEKIVNREQAAYITDTILSRFDLYTEAEDTLSFVPTVLTAEMFEREVLAKMDDGERETRRLQAFYLKKDLNDPALTELAKQELLTMYSSFANVLAETAIYIFDPLASEREMLEIISYYNHYTTLKDADIARMYIEYGIVSTNLTSINELVPICLIGMVPNIDTGDITAEDLYIKTTLADESLTKEEYDYMLESYLQAYVLNNYNYYKLKDNITAAQKKEIAEILGGVKIYADMVTELRSSEGVEWDAWNLRANTSDVPEEEWDQYEKFDDEYGIPLVVETWRLDNVFTNIYKSLYEANEEEILLNNQYIANVLKYYELVDYSSEHMNVNPEDVTVYKLRDDISEDDRAAIDSYMMFENAGRDKVSVFEINGACEYKDINSISEWARASVEKMNITGLMTGVPGEKFNPEAKLTWGQSAKIINNMICGIIVH